MIPVSRRIKLLQINAYDPFEFGLDIGFLQCFEILFKPG